MGNDLTTLGKQKRQLEEKLASLDRDGIHRVRSHRLDIKITEFKASLRHHAQSAD